MDSNSSFEDLANNALCFKDLIDAIFPNDYCIAYLIESSISTIKEYIEIAKK